MTTLPRARTQRPGRRKAASGAVLRRDLARRLPGQVSALLGEYEAFAADPDRDTPADAKAWSAHHAACKAALQHAEMLIKLLRWAESGAAETDGAGGAGDAAGAGDLEGLLTRARAALGTAGPPGADDDDHGGGEDEGDANSE